MHVDEIGVTFRMNLLSGGSPYDLTGASVVFLFRPPPPATTAVEVAATVTDAAGGVAEWVSDASILTVRGRWRWQAQVEIGGALFYSVERSFDVADHL